MDGLAFSHDPGEQGQTGAEVRGSSEVGLLVTGPWGLRLQHS